MNKEPEMNNLDLPEVTPTTEGTEENIEATDKADALVKAREYARINIEWGGNYDSRSVQVVKKLQRKP